MNLRTPKEWSDELALRIRQHRVAKGWTQKELGERAGVSLGSYKRFEQTGRIELLSLIKIAQVLSLDDDFDALFQPRRYQTLDEIEAQAVREPSKPRASGKAS